LAAETAIQKQIDFTRNLDNMSAQERIRNLEDWGRANADILEIAGENAREFYDELKRLREEDKRGWDAVGESINRWVDKTSNWGARLGEIMTGALDDVSGALTDMIMGAEVDWKRLTRSILADLIQMIIRMQMAKALTAFGFGGVAHAGGIVGATPFPVRMVPAGTFENAPRLHSGLASDEYPAILQRGERVIPRGNGTKESGGGVTVNMPTEVRIHNEGSEKLVITKEESYMMGDQRIIDVTMKAAESDGRFRKTFGIGRR